METLNILSQTYSVTIILFVSLFFLLLGINYSRKFLDLDNYLLAGRSVKTVSLTSSLIASSLGTWVLFGPASAATWGGMGAVVGYSLGTAFPMFFLIYLGKKFRKEYPDSKTLIEVIRLKYGAKLFKLIFLLSFFYMFIFLIAEVTAVSLLVKYFSGTPLWITSLIIVICSMIYTLYGGLKVSIFTDKIQFALFSILIIISFSYLIYVNYNHFNINLIMQTKPELFNLNNKLNYTAGLTFFIAVAATNLFHQGNWQRVYAAKNYRLLKTSLIISFLVIIPIVFLMGFTGIIAASINTDVIPDLAFFSLILKKQNFYISIVLVLLSISLTISSIDTIINAISSLIIVDSSKVLVLKVNLIKFPKTIIFIICAITFIIASTGLSILYLFLLADLLCCAAVLSVFYSFYKKNFNEKVIILSITFGLLAGLLFFPSPDFSKSTLVGTLIPIKYFPAYIKDSLLFWSFIIATFLPVLFWRLKIK